MLNYTKALFTKVEPLPVPTPYIVGETLTSWLLRASLNQGCNVGALLFYHWDKYKLRQVDFDKGFNHVDTKIHEDIAILAQTDVATFEQFTLTRFSEVIEAKRSEYKNIQWVLPVSKTLKTSQQGHYYCPTCLEDDETAHLDLNWRFAWYVYCHKHLRVLQDKCKYCGLLYQPSLIQANQRYINRCPHCQQKLAIIVSDALLIPDAYQFQMAALSAWQNNQATALGVELNAHDWFELMGFFHLIVRQVHNTHTKKFKDLLKRFKIRTHAIPIKKIKTGWVFELLPFDERVMLMAYATRLSKVPIDEWVAGCKAVGLQQGHFHFGKAPTIPTAFLPILNELEPITQLTRNVKQKEYKDNVEDSQETRSKELKPKSAKAVALSWARMQVRIERLAIS